MSKRKEKEDIKMTIFIMVAGIALMVLGVFGIVTSRIEKKEYAASTDDNGDVDYTTYKFKISYEIDGKTYKGKYEERVWPRDIAKTYTYDKLRKGDTIKVEVYKTTKGNYKLSPEGNPVDFLLYCAAIPFGLFLVVIMICDIVKDKRKKKSENEVVSKE